jgi:hypothetical protein
MELMLVGNPSGLLVLPANYSRVELTRALPTSAMITELGQSIAAEIGGKLRTYVDLPEVNDPWIHVEYIIDVDDREAIITAHLDIHASASVGYAGPWVPAKRIEGDWDISGAAIYEPGWVGVHRESNLRALLRNSTAGVA